MENMMELVPQLTPQLTTVKLEDLVVDVSSSSSAAYVSSFAYPTLSTSSPSTIGMFASTHMRVTPRARFDHVKTAKTEPDSSGAVVLDLKPTVLGAGMRGDAGARDARDAPGPVELGVGAGARLQGDDTANEGAQDAEAGPDVENGDADGSGDRPLFTAERIVDAWQRAEGDEDDMPEPGNEWDDDHSAQPVELPREVDATYRSDPAVSLDPARCEWFLVQWQGYPLAASTWEHASSLLNYTDLITAFFKNRRAADPCRTMGVVNVDDPPEGPVFADFASSSEAQIAKDEMGRAVGVTLTKVSNPSATKMFPSLAATIVFLNINKPMLYKMLKNGVAAKGYYAHYTRRQAAQPTRPTRRAKRSALLRVAPTDVTSSLDSDELDSEGNGGDAYDEHDEEEEDDEEGEEDSDDDNDDNEGEAEGKEERPVMLSKPGDPSSTKYFSTTVAAKNFLQVRLTKLTAALDNSGRIAGWNVGYLNLPATRGPPRNWGASGQQHKGKPAQRQQQAAAGSRGAPPPRAKVAAAKIPSGGARRCKLVKAGKPRATRYFDTMSAAMAFLGLPAKQGGHFIASGRVEKGYRCVQCDDDSDSDSDSDDDDDSDDGSEGHAVQRPQKRPCVATGPAHTPSGGRRGAAASVHDAGSAVVVTKDGAPKKFFSSVANCSQYLNMPMDIVRKRIDDGRPVKGHFIKYDPSLPCGPQTGRHAAESRAKASRGPPAKRHAAPKGRLLQAQASSSEHPRGSKRARHAAEPKPAAVVPVEDKPLPQARKGAAPSGAATPSVPTETTSAADVTRWLRDSRRFDAGILAKFKGVDGMMLRACTLEDFVTETGLAPLAARGLLRILHPTTTFKPQ